MSITLLYLIKPMLSIASYYEESTEELIELIGVLLAIVFSVTVPSVERFMESR
jgi:hypothetical protein